MPSYRSIIALAGAVASLSACVSNKPTPAAASAMKADSALAASALAVNRWKGEFKPMLQSTANLGSGTQRLYGTANIASQRTTPLFKVTLSLDSQRGSEMLGWAVVTGQCAKGGVNLMQPNSLPPLEIRAGGRGELTADVFMTLQKGETYHVNLYQGGGNNEDAVIACALLRYSVG
ncbi:MAG: hypothetical protein JWO05_3582 [Gemmatimonadetes bacterium]|nr:hypothetical protein [Gemmatimonadota bacterium]